MFEIAILIIFTISFAGVLLMLFRKLPALATLPRNGRAGVKGYKGFAGIENKIKKVTSFFSDGIFMHRLLSWSKCRVIQIETWIDSILHGIRKKAKEKKISKK